MRYTRLTLTINNIPIHKRNKGDTYRSTRLTVFLFGQTAHLNDFKLLLVSFTEEVVGYDMTDWWFDADINIAEQGVNPHEAKGLGFYRAECAYEDDDGTPFVTQIYDAHTRKFGEEMF